MLYLESNIVDAQRHLGVQELSSRLIHILQAVQGVLHSTNK